MAGWRWLWRSALGSGCVLAIMATTQSAVAQMSIDEYTRNFVAAFLPDKGEAKSEEAADLLVDFHFGMDSTLAAANAAFVQAGAKSAFCLPEGRLTMVAMTDALRGELVKRRSFWERRLDSSIGLVAIAALKTRYPCK